MSKLLATAASKKISGAHKLVHLLQAAQIKFELVEEDLKSSNEAICWLSDDLSRVTKDNDDMFHELKENYEEIEILEESNDDLDRKLKEAKQQIKKMQKAKEIDDAKHRQMVAKYEQELLQLKLDRNKLMKSAIENKIAALKYDNLVTYMWEQQLLMSGFQQEGLPKAGNIQQMEKGLLKKIRKKFRNDTLKPTFDKMGKIVDVIHQNQEFDKCLREVLPENQVDNGAS